MGSHQVLIALIGRCRAALRVDGRAVLVGHGMADQVYRPPRLPYASVVGALCLETESERTHPARVVRVRNPGYLAGRPRTAPDQVPAPGSLALLLDGDTSLETATDFGVLAGTPFTDPDAGPAVAAALQAALRAAVADGDAREGGAAVTGPARLAELAAVTARWDGTLQRLVIASGRRGPLVSPIEPGTLSAVTVTPATAGPDRAAALGFTAEAFAAPGTVTRSRDAAATAVAMDIRLDLWAGSQAELATMLDAWTAATPIRGELLLAPTLLAADVTAGDSTVRLLPAALPRTPSTVLAAVAADGFTDRIGDRPVQLAGATVTPTSIRLTGIQTAQFGVASMRPVPEPWQPHPVGARGWAVGLSLRVEPGAAAGATSRVLRLAHGQRTALQLEVTAEPNRYLLHGTAEHADGNPLGDATVAVDRTALEGATSIAVHAVADGPVGAVRVFAESATDFAAAAPAAGPTPAGSDADLVLVLGDPSGGAIALHVEEIVVHSRPLGPPDPRLRGTGPVAATWAPGDPLTLVTSLDGFSAGGTAFLSYVLGVIGDEVQLDRPVSRDYPRGTSLAHQGALFFAQRQLRRHDDLMNRLYRAAFEYRVSGFLDDTAASVSAPLVERPEVELRDYARLLAEQADPPGRLPRPVPATVGITVTDLPTAVRTSGNGHLPPGHLHP